MEHHGLSDFLKHADAERTLKGVPSAGLVSLPAFGALDLFPHIHLPPLSSRRRRKGRDCIYTPRSAQDQQAKASVSECSNPPPALTPTIFLFDISARRARRARSARVRRIPLRGRRNRYPTLRFPAGLRRRCGAAGKLHVAPIGRRPKRTLAPVCLAHCRRALKCVVESRMVGRNKTLAHNSSRPLTYILLLSLYYLYHYSESYIAVWFVMRST